ncbi:hypothetical protein GCM10025782_00640 [Pedococcus ginsenosidimutans]|uniref:Uncharacterized protein n=1 Tax=Pedococcus ginsenosidimutans TaxID=490570 RepID=A0ABP8XJ78_9MICO
MRVSSGGGAVADFSALVPGLAMVLLRLGDSRGSARPGVRQTSGQQEPAGGSAAGRSGVRQ